MNDFSLLKRELSFYDKEWCVKFVLSRIKDFVHIWEQSDFKNDSPQKAILAVQNLLKDPSEANKEKAINAANSLSLVARAMGDYDCPRYYFAIACGMAVWTIADSGTVHGDYAASAIYWLSLIDGGDIIGPFERYKKTLALNTVSLEVLNAGL